MIDTVKAMLKAPSPQQLALRELEEAQRELLKSQSLYEYAGRMTSYHQDRISRLSRFLAKSNEGQP
jgi:hypothetical protein